MSELWGVVAAAASSATICPRAGLIQATTRARAVPASRRGRSAAHTT